MKKPQVENLNSFDKESFKVVFEQLIPRLITEMSDLLERSAIEIST